MNKADEQRIRQFYKLGCVACWLDDVPNPQYDVHHLLSGGIRIGDHATIPLCPWHHRGTFAEASSEIAKAEHGPSMALHPKQFTVKYGTQRELLKLVDGIILGEPVI